MRQVIIHSEQWGKDFSVTGGRGNGIFIESQTNSRGLSTGDQILQVSVFV